MIAAIIGRLTANSNPPPKNAARSRLAGVGAAYPLTGRFDRAFVSCFPIRLGQHCSQQLPIVQRQARD